VNSKLYANNILQPFFQIVTEEEKQHKYLQQDNTAVHTSQHSVEALRKSFDERIISWGRWLPRSPGIRVYDFYLRGKLNQNVHRNNLRTLEAQENEIGGVMHDITKSELQ
jgi:hypothetical protein